MRKNEVKAKVVVDVHEPLNICTLLSEFDLEVERKSISPGDYIVGEGWAVERKTTGDFVQSLFKGRLLEQLDRLSETYSKPVLLVEGDLEVELGLRRNPRAIWGALIKIQVDNKVPVMFSPDMIQTANILVTMARRAQRRNESKIQIRTKRRFLDDSQRQIFIAEGLPNIGEEMASRLLNHFGNLQNLFQAKDEDLMKINGVGKIVAGKITTIIHKEYNQANPDKHGKRQLKKKLEYYIKPNDDE